MPVFENLKNFIRHGKQAQNGLEPISSRNSGRRNQHPPITHSNSEPLTKTTMFSEGTAQTKEPAPVAKAAAPAKKVDKEKYNDAIKEIVEEEKLQQSKIPHYPGLERYKLIEKMGDGAFSIVYKAVDLQTKEEVAVKVIRKFELNANQRSSILKEVAIMRQLRHKNVVQLIDFSESENHYFIVLELLPGGELFHQIVRLTYFSEDLARHVILQVAEAVRYLHEEVGVVHRDIKPENLLFYPAPFTPSKKIVLRKGEDESKEDEGKYIPGVGAGGIGVIKLADFGLSKVVWDSKTMTPCGTVGYTAPEIVKDERYSKSVDMWALGCVLYTILCGFPPFYDDSIDVLTEKVARGQYTFLSPWWDEISKGAKDLVSHLLTVDPERRYTIEDFLAHPWITQSNEPTHPALDSPMASILDHRKGHTAATTAISRENVEAEDPQSHDSASTLHVEHPVEGASTSSFEDPQATYRSPATVTLKEVFDVSNAVHRMEEENARRRRMGGSKNLGMLTEIITDEEDEDDDTLEGGMSRVSVNENPHAHKRQKQKGRSGVFELKLDGATLLEKRKRAAAGVA
ncbi:Calcium/calmodulin-dependent protein kinase type II [Yarrowia sp. C11]|nr:Calcium/calmodulin-dependent protein kinase type II [Yarrowia sp. E02]KAG5371879.1 Calcium/calmodulin-dependent protein kinase type II [Yarrowia sp. C11]